MQQAGIFRPVFLDLDPQFKMYLAAHKILDILARLRADFLDGRPGPAYDHGLVRRTGDINHGMNHSLSAAFILLP